VATLISPTYVLVPFVEGTMVILALHFFYRSTVEDRKEAHVMIALHKIFMFSVPGAAGCQVPSSFKCEDDSFTCSGP
jgi:CRISPR/Cas system endoribonuclease Cas6 (RAMP superfamily)